MIFTKRIALGLFLVFPLCLMTCATAGTAPANGTNTGEAEIPVASGDDFVYEIIGEGPEQTVTITGYKGNAGSIRIPDKIEGIPVTVIAGMSSYSFRTVIIPEGVTSIGPQCFGPNPKDNEVRQIILPQSVTFIGMMAFSDDLEVAAYLMRYNRAPYTLKVIIGANVELEPVAIPLAIDDFYKKNGRKAGVYSIRKGSSTFDYSATM